MRRVVPGFLTTFAALSLVACAVLLFWWARGQFGDMVWARCVGNSVLIFGIDGRGARMAQRDFFDATIYKDSPELYLGPSRLLRTLRGNALYGSPVQASRMAGVEVYTNQPGMAPAFRAVAFPILYPIAATAVLPCLWIARGLRGRRRAARGMCRVCGYDLRESPDRCPECGTDVSLKAA